MIEYGGRGFWAAFALGRLGDERVLPDLQRAAADHEVAPTLPVSRAAQDAIAFVHQKARYLANNPDFAAFAGLDR